jgi:hypothetical protein
MRSKSNCTKTGANPIKMRLMTAMMLLVSFAVISLWASSAFAFPTYDNNGGKGNAFSDAGPGCDGCHGPWAGTNYISPLGLEHSNSLMFSHAENFPDSCATCHSKVGKRLVPLVDICGDCHGREEDAAGSTGPSGVPVRSAGLRASHAQLGVGVCADCHTGDADVSTLASEDTVPLGMDAQGIDPCNDSVFVLNGGGLDNDGDGAINADDTADCGGGIVDTDGDGVEDGLDQCPGTPLGTPVDGSGCPPPVPGCMDEAANNYNADATEDDGSCTYDVLGCTDPTAINYNADANVDDGSCIAAVEGCTDSTANNYNANANVDDGSCTYDVFGCTDPTANNYNADATVDDGSCTHDPVDVLGCTDPTANNYNADATVDDGSCTHDPVDVLGCTDPTANNYNADATVDDGSCTHDPVDVLGCTDPTANNYNADATVDDGSCTHDPVDVLGCTDPTANNYNADATVDDGSCTFDTGDKVTLCHKGKNTLVLDDPGWIDHHLSHGDTEGVCEVDDDDDDGNNGGGNNGGGKGKPPRN